MLKELGWYIETERFTNMVHEFDDRFEKYSLLRSGGEKVRKEAEAAREDLRKFCQWHMKKSGHQTGGHNYINIDAEFFNGNDLNRTAVNAFEKEVIKAHMYQKYLWEFMGTTGNMTVISRMGMEKDGFNYSYYLPIDYKENHKSKNPLSKILEKNPDCVPVYVYNDGSVSDFYDEKKARIRFDTIKDKSGFDWSSTGYDPNFEVSKNRWHSGWDENNVWQIHEISAAGFSDTESGNDIPFIELIRDGDNVILYDPGYSLLDTFKRVFLLDDGRKYGELEQDTSRTVEIIRQTMKEMGVSRISGISGKYVTGKELPQRVETESELRSKTHDIVENVSEINRMENRKQNAYEGNIRKNHSKSSAQLKALALYKKLFKGMIAEDCREYSFEETASIKKTVQRKQEENRTAEEGRELKDEISAVISLGKKGSEITEAVRRQKVRVPLSCKNREDCLKAGISEAEYEELITYAIPDNRESLFSRVLFNILAVRKLLESGGITATQIFDGIFNGIVKGKYSENTVDIETTLGQICRTRNTTLPSAPVESGTLEILEETWRKIPEQRTPELQAKVKLAVENIIRNFGAIRMSTGMKPEEAVKEAVKIAGGRTGEFVPPVSGIVYTPGGSLGEINGTKKADSAAEKRIFAELNISELIKKAAGQKPVEKEVEIYSLPQLKKDMPEKIAGQTKAEIKAKTVNLFDEAQREKWYASSEFKKSGLTKVEIEKLVAEAKEQQAGDTRIRGIQLAVDLVSEESIMDRIYGYKKAGSLKESAFVRIKPAMKESPVPESTSGRPVEPVRLERQNGLVAERRIVQVIDSGSMHGLNESAGKEFTRAEYIKTAAAAENSANGPGVESPMVSDKENSVISATIDTVILGETSVSGRVSGKEFQMKSEVYENHESGNRIHKAGLSEQEKAGTTLPANIVNGSATVNAAARRIHSTKKLSSKTAAQTPEEAESARMGRINRNYEHDLAILQREKPQALARSESHDVGHAVGSEEEDELDRNKKRNVMKKILSSDDISSFN